MNNGKKVHKNYVVWAHSGRQKLYEEFIDTIQDDKFIEGLRDIGGRPRKNDSEIKFIYHFLTEHWHKAEKVCD